MAPRYHVVNYLRVVEVPDHAAIKNVLSLKRCQKDSGSGRRDPRPTLFKFVNLRHCKRFLAAADETKNDHQSEAII